MGSQISILIDGLRERKTTCFCNDYDLQKIQHLFCFLCSKDVNTTTPCHSYLIPIFIWEVKIQQEATESSAFFWGKYCVQNRLFWLLALFISCDIYIYSAGKENCEKENIKCCNLPHFFV